MTKVIYFIASHTNPEQVLRLVKTLRAGSPLSEIVIHHDYSKSYLAPSAFEDIPNTEIIADYVPVTWGDFSVVKMMLHVFKKILVHHSFDWLVFISGQDYPIQPVGQIEHFLATTHYDGFISAVPIEAAIPCGPVECSLKTALGKLCWDCLTRYHYHYYQIPAVPFYHKLPGRVRNMIGVTWKRVSQAQALIYGRTLPVPENTKTMVGLRSLWTPFTATFKCYKGSHWLTLNRACVQYIDQFIGENPRYVKYYQRTLIPDESFFQTILLNHPSLKLLNTNKRLIRWNSAKAPSPDTLQVEDLEGIMASGQHFARKFDTRVDEKILDLIDERILQGQKRDIMIIKP